MPKKADCIQPCKFSPERTIPLHSSAVSALRRYRDTRHALFPAGDTFFVGATGQPFMLCRAEKIFRRLTQDLTSTGQRRSLRLLDFRHTFASQRIAQWSCQSQPVAHHLLLLARYLGHRTFNSTWWYVSSDPESLRTASNSFRLFYEDRHET
jgi:integrase